MPLTLLLAAIAVGIFALLWGESDKCEKCGRPIVGEAVIETSSDGDKKFHLGCFRRG
jgi:hypothetical protein